MLRRNCRKRSVLRGREDGRRGVAGCLRIASASAFEQSCEQSLILIEESLEMLPRELPREAHHAAALCHDSRLLVHPGRIFSARRLSELALPARAVASNELDRREPLATTRAAPRFFSTPARLPPPAH